MNPVVGRIALSMAILFILLSLIPLPYLLTRHRHSAEFVIDIFALCFSLIFLFLVVWDIRRQVKKEVRLRIED
ncbi:MAG: hypothetical protein DRJ49_07685 [Thermoprotei archaeon]|nr:MAG: hypothetical protein DRJ49_07685 [Thermoprotei archaeon]